MRSTIPIINNRSTIPATEDTVPSHRRQVLPPLPSWATTPAGQEQRPSATTMASTTHFPIVSSCVTRRVVRRFLRCHFFSRRRHVRRRCCDAVTGREVQEVNVCGLHGGWMDWAGSHVYWRAVLRCGDKKRCCAVGIRSCSGVVFLVGETSGLWRSAVVYSVGPDIWWVVGEWWEWWASGCLPILERLSYCRECLGAVGPSLSRISPRGCCVFCGVSILGIIVFRGVYEVARLFIAGEVRLLRLGSGVAVCREGRISLANVRSGVGQFPKLVGRILPLPKLVGRILPLPKLVGRISPLPNLGNWIFRCKMVGD